MKDFKCVLNKVIFIEFIISAFSILSISGATSYYSIPNECQVITFTYRQIASHEKGLKCQIDSKSQLRLNERLLKNESIENSQIKNKEEIHHLIIRPKREKSVKLDKGMIDLQDFLNYFKNINHTSIFVTFELFDGFALELFDDGFSDDISSSVISFQISCVYCNFEFYLGKKPLKSCQDIIETGKSAKSIFQLFSKMSRLQWNLFLRETSSKLCPLAFKDVQLEMLFVLGDNSFYSRKLLTFSQEVFKDLNSIIDKMIVNINNVNLDFDFLHPSVFENLIEIEISTQVNKIDPNLFSTFASIFEVYFRLEYMRKMMHNNGIEWIKNMNKDVNCDLKNSSQVKLYLRSFQLKFIYHDQANSPVSPSICEVFPDEDFCLYRDFPINQLVIMLESSEGDYKLEQSGSDFGCTYLWITRSYKDLVQYFSVHSQIYLVMRFLLDSDNFKSISDCNFESKLQLCNRSTFELLNKHHISTIYELGEAFFSMSFILNILSYALSIFGLVTNTLIIVTISSKANEADFKGFKQYDYLRLNSICNSLILFINMISWLNHCVYPYQVFCPTIRKAVFMQYFKIITQDVLMTALRFMNSFTYIGFAFNRISLIGKDHNKLVKFMCKLSIPKYIGFSIFISILLSAMKFFQYDINPGVATLSYPISYDYRTSGDESNPIPAFFIVDFISDMLNHFVLLLVNLAIDIGMIVKLKQTLKERLENFKAYSTIAQQEKKKTENENVMDNAVSMVILNTFLNFLLKLPTSSYSFIYLYYGIYRHYNLYAVNGGRHRSFERFMKRICIDAYFCDMLLELADFLYLICISIQLFFYKHYDKKFNSASKRIFNSNKSIQMGLMSYFNLVNVVNSPFDLPNEKKQKCDN